jgi:hypothetical protein
VKEIQTQLDLKYIAEFQHPYICIRALSNILIGNEHKMTSPLPDLDPRTISFPSKSGGDGGYHAPWLGGRSIKTSIRTRSSWKSPDRDLTHCIVECIERGKHGLDKQKTVR